MERSVESLQKEYIREFLRPGGSNEEKLEQLDEWIERICPIKLPEQFEKDRFYQDLMKRIRAEESKSHKEMLVKAAMAAVVIGIGGNGVCEAATGNSILHYIKEAGKQVQEFRIEIDDRINITNKGKEEGGIVEYQEEEVSSWQEIQENCSWEFQYPREKELGIIRQNLYTLTDEGAIVSITSEYEKEHGVYYLFTVDHYEKEQGSADYSIPEDAKEIKTERIAKIKLIYYQTGEEIVVIGTSDREIYEIMSNDTLENVTRFVKTMDPGQ